MNRAPKIHRAGNPARPSYASSRSQNPLRLPFATVPQGEREIQRCRQTKAALTTKFHTVPINAPANPASHHLLS